nr:transposase [Streptomyces sp. NRRL S-241]
MARIRVPRGGPRRPRTRPFAVLADRAYSSRAIRNHLCRRASVRSSRSRPTRSAPYVEGQRGGRPTGFDREACKQRNTVERCLNRLKQWHGLATRTDQLALAYQSALHLAGLLIRTRP